MQVLTAYRRFFRRLASIYEAGEAASIARIVFEDVFGIRNLQRQDNFSPEQAEQLEAITARLLQHEPVQYVLGMADFYGLKFRVGPGVLIPRQETEELVHWILEENGPGPLRLLDIGAGSGCIPITLKKYRPLWQIEAMDVSPQALALARENAELNNTAVRFEERDILDRKAWMERGLYDIIVSNPPYILRRETHLMPQRVLDYEPHLALFVDGEEALLFYQAIAEFASGALRKGGSLFFEVNEFNAGEVVQFLEKQGFSSVSLRQDLNSKDRMVKGHK